MERRDYDLPALLREWAEWVTSLQGLGYASSTPIWRAQHSAGGGEFASAPPAGLRLLESSSDLRRLTVAMDALTRDDDTRQQVSCVQSLYLFGPIKCIEFWGKSKTKFYENVRTGELLIRREMKRG